MKKSEDPVLIHARREAIIIISSWAAATAYCCTYCYFFGYTSESHPLGKADIHPILGMPSWFFWGVMAPWLVCGLFIVWFAGTQMADDDLGQDHSGELESDIRERAELS